MDLNMNSISLSILIPILVAIYLLGLCIARLFLSPIAHIPGPKLAALTFWYEFYYDVICRGQYFREIDRLHGIYGRIIRINPYEIHIQDPAFYSTLYTGATKKRHKWAWAARMFGNNTSAFSTVRHEHHRVRRGALNPLFSKSAIHRITPRILDRLGQLVGRLDMFCPSTASGYCKDNGMGQAVDLGMAFTAFAADVITEYCFGSSLDLIHTRDFGADWVEMVSAPSELGHLVKQCPWVLPLLRYFPRALVRKMAPLIAFLYEVQETMSSQIQPLVDRVQQEKAGSKPSTVFETLLAGDLPAAEKTVQRLKGEGQTLIGAGTLTTGNALKTILFHVQDNPEILERLQCELDTALEGIDVLGLPDTSTLERLPYLTAVINEGLRLAYGVTHRLQLLAEEPLVYSDKTLPVGTPISMTSIFMHDNPAVFPSPRTFSPDRWLEMSPEDRSKIMGKHFVPFSKGTRMCLGMHLAYAEMYLVLATVFTRYKVVLDGTRREDVEMAHDFFDPAPMKGARGLVVRLQRR
ncbi:cytochrome P450 [Aspergillus unguis]